MEQLRLIIRLVWLSTLQTSVCSSNGLGAMPANRGMPGTPLPEKPDTVYVPYRGSIPNLFLSTSSDQTSYRKTHEWCTLIVRRSGVPFWYWDGDCHFGKLFTPVCRVDNANETGYMIKESFLTDGSPDDDSNQSLLGRPRFITGSSVAFRVMTPTIPEFPEFTTEIDFHPPKLPHEISSQRGKIFVFPKLGGLVTTDDSILVDPSCHTNNTCGVAFLTTSAVTVKTPHVALDQHCSQTIHLNDTKVLSVFSHAGIGCKLFPDVYPTPNCELTITSPSAFTANVTLVNFRKTTCGGYELKFVTSTCTVDVCQENSPTVFDSSDGKMQIKLTGRASENWPRYGFIIRLEKVTQMNKLSQCSSINAVQGATDDSQVSTTAPAESPTNSPVQGATDDVPQVSTTSPAESSTISPVQGATDDVPQVSTTAPPESSTNSPVQGATDDFPQVSTTAPPESPTNSPVQGATDDFPQVSTTAPTESSTNSPVQGATDDFPQVSTTAPTESFTNSPAQGATDDVPQVSTTAPAESPTNSPVQNPTDASDEDLPEASLESSSATEFISDPTGSFESESPSVSPKSPTNSYHLHLMLALGIEL